MFQSFTKYELNILLPALEGRRIVLVKECARLHKFGKDSYDFLLEIRNEIERIEAMINDIKERK